MATKFDIKQALGKLNPLRRRQASSSPPAVSNPAPSTTVPTTQAGKSSNAPVQQPQGGTVNLVNYTPEQLVQHVDQSLQRVQFGWSTNITIMENYSEFWALAGPAILLLGTIGEVFLVLWLRQKVQDILAGLSIVAVALVLEGTFLAVSYKSATIRGRAERRPGGKTPLDRQKLRRQLVFWVALAAGVCATQVIFVAAQTKDDGIGTYGVWIFAILRAVFTLVADGYTAFAHEEKPTTAEKDLEEQEQRAKHTQLLLSQKQKEVTMINDGILQVREAHTEAQIKDDKMQTRLQVEKMQNKTQVETLQTQAAQAAMFTKLGNNIMRALFDPELPEEQRQKLLATMQGFMSAANALPEPKEQPHIGTTVTEEEDL